MRREFHDLAELALNQEGQAWGNLGYWQTATDYSNACCALARILGEEAGLNSQSIVFDAGFGCGDQLLLWQNHFRVARVGGVNLSFSQTDYAKAMLDKAGFGIGAANIVQGNIDDPEAWKLAADYTAPSHVLALDCAYHFPSKVVFLQLARHHLARSGRLALTDFVLCSGPDAGFLAPRLLRGMLRLSHIPAANLVHPEQYRHQLQEAGFGKIRMTDISEQVMLGFALFTKSRLRDQMPADIRKGPRRSSRLKYWLTGHFLQWAHRRSLLRYVLISATKAD
ncbi:hypothetical protein [Parasphingorhabdus sp.]|uniref:hypothetical protein n=1 Tax=Parasphingorhabdus sp. TaxID=2709688 RepID=UPI00300369B2